VLPLAALVDPSGPEVADHLHALAARAGVPRVVVSDHGADVLAGIRRFCRDHQDTAELYDAQPFAAHRLKARWADSPSWAAFQTGVGRARAARQPTEWAFVVPPALRTKSRSLNLDRLLAWAWRALALRGLAAARRPQGDGHRLEKALGWLRELAGRWSSGSRGGNGPKRP
jgi:hypothetical protein